MENLTAKDGKGVAIISYITIIGTIVAIILNNNKRNAFASFHIRQALGINLFYLINKLVLAKFFGSIIIAILFGIILVLGILGFISAIQEEEKEIPFIGEHFQEWFRNI